MVVKSVWGIDIGRVALKAIRLAKNEQGRLEVLAYEFIEHSRILSQPEVDAELADGLIRETLEKFVSRQDIFRSDVVTSLPGSQSFARFAKLPPVEPKQVPMIVQFEAGQQIPFPLEEVVWDYQTFQEPNSPDLQVGIFAIKREIVARHLAYYKTVSLSPTIIQMNPMALYNFATYDGQLAEDGATVLINVGADSTDLIIADQALLWQRTFPLGGNSFTTALVNTFKLSFSKAEALKRTSGRSKYSQQVYQAMKPAFGDLLAEINKSVGHFSQMHRDSQIKKFLLVGNTFRTPGLAEYLRQNLNGEVVRVKHFSKIAGGGLAAMPAFAGHAATLATAYGLALQGLGLAKIHTNLLPTEQARQLLWQRKTLWFLSSAACLTIAGGVLWASNTINQKRYEDQARIRADCQQVLNEAREAKAKFETVRIAGQEEIAKILRIQSLQTPAVKAMVPKIYDVVIRSLPKHPALAARSTAEYKASLSKEPRRERQIIVIDNLAIRYVPDFLALDNPDTYNLSPGWGTGLPGTGVDAPLGWGVEPPARPGKPGFEVTIIGHSPYKNLNNLLASNFIANLRDLGNKPNLPFSIEKEGHPIRWIKAFQEQDENLGAEIPGLTTGLLSDMTDLTQNGGGYEAPGTACDYFDPLFPGNPDEIESNDKLFKLTLRVYMKSNPNPGAMVPPS